MTDVPASYDQPYNMCRPVVELPRREGRFAYQTKGKALGLSSETVGKLAAGALALVMVFGVAVVVAIAS